MSHGRVLPVEQAYWAAIRRHELVLPWCDTCARSWFPAALRCRACGSSEISWRKDDGVGEVASYVELPESAVPSGTERPGRTVVAVDLRTGARVIAFLAPGEPSPCGGDRVVVRVATEAGGEQPFLWAGYEGKH